MQPSQAHYSHVSTRPSIRSRECPPLPPGQGPLSLNHHIWEVALRQHPDRLFVEHVLRGLKQGFRLSFDSTHPLRAVSQNMTLAYITPDIVSAYIQAECNLGRILGPYTQPSMGLMISRFGFIPKKHQMKKWRLILDLIKMVYVPQ